MSEETKNTELNEGGAQKEQEQESKSYTQAELNDLLQKEGDRRVSEALKKQEKKNAEKIREAEKLAKMDEAQKFQYELEQREKAIELKEKELALAENKNACAKILADKGISLQLVDFVVSEDADTMNANIKLLENAFNQSVKQEVEKRLGSSTPKKNLPMDTSMTKEEFSKIKDATVLMQLKREQPDLWAQYTK